MTVEPVDEIAVTASLATLYGRIAQLVRVRRSHRRGPRFESVYAHPNSRSCSVVDSGVVVVELVDDLVRGLG